MNKNILKITTILSSLIVMPAVVFAKPTVTPSKYNYSGNGYKEKGGSVEAQNGNNFAEKSAGGYEDDEGNASIYDSAYINDNGKYGYKDKSVAKGEEKGVSGSKGAGGQTKGASEGGYAYEYDGNTEASKSKSAYSDGKSAYKSKSVETGEVKGASEYKGAGGQSKAVSKDKEVYEENGEVKAYKGASVYANDKSAYKSKEYIKGSGVEVNDGAANYDNGNYVEVEGQANESGASVTVTEGNMDTGQSSTNTYSKAAQ